MVYPLPYCPLANWSQFCPSSAFCSSVLPLESRFSLQLLVVHFTPCPTLAIFSESQHGRLDMVPQLSTPAPGAMCPADYIPVCVTLYGVCFLHNSGALLTCIEFA